jgi:Ca2+-binding EF-hand superfamily protein
MFARLPAPVDFPAFLTHVTSLSATLSRRDDLASAFSAFDEKDNGLVDYAKLKYDLMNSGPKRMTEDEVDSCLQPFVERMGKNKGKVSYTKLLDSVLGVETPSRP